MTITKQYSITNNQLGLGAFLDQLGQLEIRNFLILLFFIKYILKYQHD